MRDLPTLMNAVIAKVAIQRRRDYLVKPLFFLLGISVMITCLENTLMPVEDRQPFRELFPMMIAGTIILGTPFFLLVTHQHNLQKRLTALALSDFLTGLPNRRAFLNNLEEKRAGGELGHVILADADHFKQVNDEFGHAAGDSCLQAIAERLKHVAGPNDLTGRLGGEEFGLFLSGMSEVRLHDVSTTLVTPIPVTLKDRDKPLTVTVTLSLGATEAAASIPVEKLLHQADVALYAAKTQGRARMVPWRPILEQAS